MNSPTLLRAVRIARRHVNWMAEMHLLDHNVSYDSPEFLSRMAELIAQVKDELNTMIDAYEYDFTESDIHYLHYKAFRKVVTKGRN